MTAQEARKKVEELHLTNKVLTIQIITNLIEEAVKKAQFNTTIYENISSPVEEHFVNLGYTFGKRFYDRDGSVSIDISW